MRVWERVRERECERRFCVGFRGGGLWCGIVRIVICWRKGVRDGGCGVLFVVGGFVLWGGDIMEFLFVEVMVVLCEGVEWCVCKEVVCVVWEGGVGVVGEL